MIIIKIIIINNLAIFLWIIIPQEYYSQTPDDRDLVPVERAIKHYLQNSQKTENSFRTSLYGILKDDGPKTGELATLKNELGKLIKVNGSDNDVYIFTPKTLRAFLNEDSEKEAYTTSFLSCACFCFSFPR